MYSSTLSLTSALDWVGGQRPRPDRFTPGTHCIGGWVGPQGRSGLVRKFSPPPGFDPRTVQLAASRYTDWAIPAHEIILYSIFFFRGATAPSGPGSTHFRCFTITLRHTTLGRTPLDEWSAWCRDLYLTTHNTHKRKTFMHPVGFEPAISASERLRLRVTRLRK